ncbi:MAG: class I SAM-dependent methyltransferase [Anaerolineae bacterium]|uniref:O-methyltransferase n=1 Tax=Candidatus Amarolinea dominans TaxID=3140696 RepID=UPI003135DC2D|nr:class I SAM-dependent methyltransferase [Anaerolineae bacterium]
MAAPRRRRPGLPAISIGPEQGKFLQLLVALTGASCAGNRHPGGYSGAWIARALPAAGRLISLEMNPRHAAFAQGQWNRLGLGATATVISGPALATLPTLTPAAPFDMIFIDADKETYPDYLEWAIRLARPGTAIVLDNVELRPAGGSGSPGFTARTGHAAYDDHAGLRSTPRQHGCALRGWAGSDGCEEGRQEC